jgi:superfamily I DNA and RNA helicase
MVTIIRGSTDKPVATRELINFFSSRENLEGILYTGYPIIGTPEGAFPIDALWISEGKGIIIFNLIEGPAVGNYVEMQDNSINKLESRLRSHQELMNKRKLSVPVNAVTFAPAITDANTNIGEFVCNFAKLQDVISAVEDADKFNYKQAISVLQIVSNIRKNRSTRQISNENSRGAKLKKLEDSISVLDRLQDKAVIETVDGVQRIRGLAGSGKTIVLALKAAYWHSIHPEWKIAVTFNTRSLKGQFKRLINSFVIERTAEEPNWENIQVIQAWGAPGGGDRDGIYYKFCEIHGIEYHDLSSAKQNSDKSSPFEYICDEALKQVTLPKPIYNAILVDEAQDFPPCFLKLCYQMLNKPYRLVYAYDELQNLGKQSLPAPEDIFGKDKNGKPVVTFESNERTAQQDIILDRCYRNSRPILVSAHALGFGIYRKQDEKSSTGIVQMFEQSSLWTDIGYQIASGQLEDGQQVVLRRTDKTSPQFLEEHSAIDDIIQFQLFDSKEKQAEWIAKEIEKNLNHDELHFDDIIVINPDPLSTRKEMSLIRTMLFDRKIPSHLAGVETSPDLFFSLGSDSITCTGIFRAKGNEAGMVYIINADDCYKSIFNLSTIRNQLFTAMTRSKAWVRVCGIGNNMKELTNEFNTVKSKDFELDFTYPTKSQRESINIVNRDISDADVKKIKAIKTEFNSLVHELKKGTILFEDFDERQVAALIQALGRDKVKKILET